MNTERCENDNIRCKRAWQAAEREVQRQRLEILGLRAAKEAETIRADRAVSSLVLACEGT